MDKKFIKVCLCICIPIILLIGIMTMNMNDDEDLALSGGHEANFGFDLRYKSYTEDKYNRIITVVGKNKSKNIATLSDLELTFRYIGKSDEESRGRQNFYIKGYKKDEFKEDSYEQKYGIDPGDEVEVTFNVPKSITFDKDIFDLENPEVSYNVSFYRFRKGNNSLLFGVGSSGGSISIKGIH